METHSGHTILQAVPALTNSLDITKVPWDTWLFNDILSTFNNRVSLSLQNKNKWNNSVYIGPNVTCSYSK